VSIISNVKSVALLELVSVLYGRSVLHLLALVEFVSFPEGRGVSHPFVQLEALDAAQQYGTFLQILTANHGDCLKPIPAIDHNSMHPHQSINLTLDLVDTTKVKKETQRWFLSESDARSSKGEGA
jgi:hypothetical protein